MKLSWGSEQAGGAGIIAAHPTRSLEYRHKRETTLPLPAAIGN
jgi:hypothetical protein